MSPSPTISHGQARDTRMQARSPRDGRTWLRVQICVDFTRRTLVSAGCRWIWARGCNDCVDWASQNALNGNGGRPGQKVYEQNFVIKRNDGEATVSVCRLSSAPIRLSHTWTE